MCCSFAAVSVDLPDDLEASFFDCATATSENIRGKITIGPIFFIIFRFSSITDINSGDRAQCVKAIHRCAHFTQNNLSQFARDHKRESRRNFPARFGKLAISWAGWLLGILARDCLEPFPVFVW